MKTQPQNLKDLYKNPLAVPKIIKVIINVGIGRLVADSKNSEEIIKKVSRDISMITGQKPTVRQAKKAIASFKTREGMPIGLMVTLRGKRMQHFINKFVNIILPQSRDFWGILLKNFDEKGNLNYGIKDHSIFPEISREQNPLTFGLEVTFVTNAKNREQAIKLYEFLNFPLQKIN
ncbi:MAG: 50S ribosomal protein L5 [Candidatus Paceibacterota bacterium]|jgi:large subunit ribosomal protein L5